MAAIRATANQSHGKSVKKRHALQTTRTGIIAAAMRILDASPYAMTVRQTYYRLVVEGVVENIPQEYKRVGEALVKAREDGDIPFDRIVDRSRSYAAPTRPTAHPSGPSSPPPPRRQLTTHL